ncbi:MAG: DUF4402 domain-containing protein [Pseudomonadota bacterium]
MSHDLSRLRFYSASLIVLASSNTAAARPTTINGNAGAKISKPLEIIASEERFMTAGLNSIAPPLPELAAVEWSSLYFGSIVPPETGSARITLSPEGARQCPVNVSCITDDHHAARFGVTGEENRFVVISIPNSMTVSSGTDTMTIENIVSSVPIAFLSDGYDEFCIGGELIVNANQSTGDYAGTYNVMVEYQ